MFSQANALESLLLYGAFCLSAITSKGSSVSKYQIVATPFQENVKLHCTPPSSLPGFRDLSWFLCPDLKLCLSSKEKEQPIAEITNKTSVRVHFSQIFQIDINGTLTIDWALPAFDGIAFLCWVHFHSIGKRKTIIHLKIRESPRVEIKSPETVYVPEGTNLSLVCLAVGWPRPQLTWTRGDEVLLNQTSNGTYIQQNVTLEDGGIYTCSAKNQFGIEYRSVKVIVLGIPGSAPSPPPGESKEEVSFARAVLKVLPLIITLLFIFLVIIILLVIKIKRPDLFDQNRV
ncbi:immunoglobulin superfamily member 10-like [Stylophora pistillata]|uniref:immunoglobulin superfamily member 10-like n=1 Tax=Stylophora pistillata TaxID=50429 RepID=UPI000C0556D6|nr:immunoglobulin superfamily member 10-like [Stylophora pistillata]